MNEHDDMSRIPPQNTDAEVCVLGAMILNPVSIGKVTEMLSVEAFYVPAHQMLYAAILQVNETPSSPLDLVSLKTHLDSHQQLEQIGGTDYLSMLVDSVPDAANIAYYATLVSDCYLKRSIIQTCGRITSEAWKPTTEAHEVADLAEQSIMSLRMEKRDKLFQIGTAAEIEVNKMDSICRGETSPGISTGFVVLDKISGMLQPGDLCVLAGSPGAGKTALADCIAWNVAHQQKGGVLVVTSEMMVTQRAKRYLQNITQIDGYKLRYPKNLTAEQWVNVWEGVQWLHASKMYAVDGSITTGQIAMQARRVQHEAQLDLIVVDYLQRIRPMKDQGQGRVEQVGAMTRDLKNLASDMGVPVLLVAAINREASREQRPPRMSDLKGSSDIEYEAAHVWLLYRPPGNDAPADEIWLKIDKARDGCKTPWEGAGALRLRWNGPTTTFTDCYTADNPPVREIT